MWLALLCYLVTVVPKIVKTHEPGPRQIYIYAPDCLHRSLYHVFLQRSGCHIGLAVKRSATRQILSGQCPFLVSRGYCTTLCMTLFDHIQCVTTFNESGRKATPGSREGEKGGAGGVPNLQAQRQGQGGEHAGMHAQLESSHTAEKDRGWIREFGLHTVVGVIRFM